MRKFSVLLILSSLLVSVPLLRADEGMWTFDNPPLKQWKERYNFEPTKEWLDNIRLASVKVGGASGGFVSSEGLIATNQHVGAGALARLSSKERNLTRDGFYATSREQELKVPNYEVTILESYEDVSQRVQSAVNKGASDTEAAAQRKAVIADIEKESTSSTGLRSEVIPMYNGGEYWLYRFKRYTDVRLVFAPEEQIAFFGGDYDNFTFPRHDLDVTFFRAYEDGKPAKTPHYFKWSPTGALDGEFVLVSGYPGATARLLTVAQLAYQRDVGNPLQAKIWNLRLKILEDYAKLGDEQARQAGDGIRSFRNSLKRLTGQQEGLLNPKQFATKKTEEAALRTALAKNTRLNAELSPAWTQISLAYAKLPAFAERIQFTTLAASRLGSIASQIVRYSEEVSKPNDKRLEELRDTRLEAFKAGLLSSAQIYGDLEEYSLRTWLEEAERNLGPNDPFVKAALGGLRPADVARKAVRETKLGDVATRKSLVDGGATAVAASTDPMVLLARRIEPIYRQLRTWNEENILNVEASAGEKIAKARFSVYGKTIPPDANSQLRIEFGRVIGYEEDTTLVPYKTTLFGLYDRAESFNFRSPWELPQRWIDRRGAIDMKTPLNFVYSADTIGGNSGSPVINRKGELVGLNFDSNVQKLSNRYWYIEEDQGSRAVGVHSAAVIEALRKVYDAGSLAEELLSHR